MNVPKTMSLYCAKCNKHTDHKLKQFKSGQGRTMSKGTRKMNRRHKSGYGGKNKFPASVKKQNKKPTFVAECPVCKKKKTFLIPKRMKKTELV
ncbi:MAG: 50S ribosomal protein L44e [Candidatus Micrarchaeota archaeon]